jgi:Flp pilus assembly protein TadD
MRKLASLLLVALGLAGCGPRAPSSANSSASTSPRPSDQFLALMNAGKNCLDQGDATNALACYRQAQALVPNDADLHLNLANAYLLAGSPTEALREADEVLQLEPNSAAAYFVKGSAHLRLAKPAEAVQALENAQKLEPGDTATCFQLGRARLELEQWEDAIAAFKEGIALDPNHLHRAAHYLLAQALRHAGRSDEAQRELELHQASFDPGGPPVSTITFEKSKHARARVPFKLEQPDPAGVRIKFVDATEATLGERAPAFSGPVGVIDLDHKGWHSLFVVEEGHGFRLLRNTNGLFRPVGVLYPAIPGGRYAKMLVGDLQNDRFSDIVVLGDKGSHLFKFATNGVAADAAQASRLHTLRATDGTLMDLDFTGKLDLVAVTDDPHDVRVLRQFGPLLFQDITSASGIPASLRNAQAVLMEDWNRDDHMDVIVSRATGPPLLLEKQRGGGLVPREPANWVAGPVFCTGDFDNDLRADLAVLGEGKITICLNGGARREIGVAENAHFQSLVASDYDNDGWLDLWAVGKTLRVWRNLGLAGFQEQTAQLGLDRFAGGPVSAIHFADFDLDGDSDVIVALAKGGLRYLRNEGGNANAQVKVQLVGNRSNASGLGCKIEIVTGGLRQLRTVQHLPVEVGVGKYRTLDSFLVHWLNWPQGSANLPFAGREPLLAVELTVQEGSCPYLYAWDGKRFRFVTDILGAAPLGLPVAPGRYTEADPEEFVWIGNEASFPPRQGKYQLQITEELREVLYLDETKLVVVDHASGTEVHPTDKLLPGPPFPQGTLMTLHHEHPLLRAETLDGQDVTAALKAVDGRRVSPPRMRIPQLRGLAEPHGLILDFGPLEASRPLVLVLNGWLRFGGGMANVAASQNASLPFPFPALEAEIAPGVWRTLAVTVGAPAGKTKTILVDLEGKLEPGARRLRLTEAFEIHWDRIALMKKQPNAQTRIAFLAPAEADLHFRGFSHLKDLPPDWPLTPDYDIVSVDSCWTIVPGGWCTRYGDVSELIAARDEGLVLINSGDELSLKFRADLPAKPAGCVREFFLYADGWDKDSDFHVATGTLVEPLPFHGMSDQGYGRERRPPFPSDELQRKYNTRWVEGKVIKPTARH